MATIVVTGGAGYIGSLLTSTLLARGHDVSVLDVCTFGGESLLAHVSNPRFRFHRLDVAVCRLDGVLNGADTVFHLAGLVGFPACARAGEAEAFRQNADATRNVFDAAERAGVNRFIFASTYSNYGRTTDGQPVTETSPLFPQSLYARTKIAAEEWLRDRSPTSRCAVVIPRFTTLFGLSPRPRFDLLVNQFVVDAYRDRRLKVYQRDYSRSFVHVADTVDALLAMMDSPVDAVRNEIFNVGDDRQNLTKEQVLELISRSIPDLQVEFIDRSYSEDLRDVRVSSEKIRTRLGFTARRTVEQGIVEMVSALESGLISDPRHPRYRNCESVLVA